MNSRKLSQSLFVLLPILVVMLTALPECVAVRMVAEDGLEEWLEFYSGFNMGVFQSGNFAPLVTGILGCLIAFMSMAYLRNGSRNLCRVIFGVSLVAVITSLIPYISGCMTNIGWKIFTVLDVEAALACELLLLI